MDDAEVVEYRDGYWVVEAGSRRYHLNERQFVGGREPCIGLRGCVGYRQGAASKAMVFVDAGEES